MAEIRIMRTSDCKPGMVLASDIINDYGAVILYQNSILDEYSINKLMKLGLNFVKIYKDYEFKEKKHAVIEAQYNNNLEEFKEIIWDISCGKTLEMERVSEVSRSISSNFDSIHDLVSCLSKVRSISEYTYAHSLNVSLLCSLLGSWLNLGHITLSSFPIAVYCMTSGNQKYLPKYSINLIHLLKKNLTK